MDIIDFLEKNNPGKFMVSPVKTQTTFKIDQETNPKELSNECDEKIIELIQKLRSFQGVSFEARENDVHIIIDQKRTTETQNQKIIKLMKDLQHELKIKKKLIDNHEIKEYLLNECDILNERINRIEEKRSKLQRSVQITALVVIISGTVILLSVLPTEIIELATTTHKVATTVLSVTNF